jgi:sarcosine oxidase
MQKFETIVLGLGAMGSASLYQLAKRGTAVLGIDRFTPPHSFGSTHGDTRITRVAIGENEQYTLLARRSHEIWRAIEAETGESLLTANGCLVISSDAPRAPTHVEGFFENTVAAAERYGIPHERLNAQEIRARFPAYKARDNEKAFFEPGGGFLRVEKCMAANLSLARKYGAEIHNNEKVLRFAQNAGGVTVTTDRGSYTADRLVIAAGAWLPELIGERYRGPFKVLRQVQYWFDVDGSIEPYLPENFPVFLWELQGKPQSIYGFPAIDGPGGGFKLATEQYSAETTADTVNREVSPQETDAMFRDYVAPYFRNASSRCLKSRVCLYTNVAGARFIIDQHPEHERVTVVSACSGHGFKHSAAIGEVVARLVTGGEPGIDLSSFKLDVTPTIVVPAKAGTQ